MGIRALRVRPPLRRAGAKPVLPTTRLGRWAVRLGIAYFVFMLTWTIVPGGAFIGLAAGVAGGVLALVAIVRDGKRAVTVFAALLPFLLAVAFVLAELLIGHD